MPSPFPRMDPYLESPELWSEVHNRLIVAIADTIAAPLRPNYYVAIEKRAYWSEPDCFWLDFARGNLGTATVAGRHWENRQKLADRVINEIGWKSPFPLLC